MDHSKFKLNNHARLKIINALNNSVQSNFSNGKADAAKDTIVRVSQALFADSKAFQDQYVDTCIEREALLTEEEFVESLKGLQEGSKLYNPERIAQMLIEGYIAAGPPKVFVSYSHDDQKHKQWVLELATKLRQNGVDATLDQWDCIPPIDVTRWMEQNLRTAARVIIICTDKYLAKANMSDGGVGYERMIITAEMSKDLDTTKFIAVVRQKTGQRAVPDFMGARIYIDFTDDFNSIIPS